MVQIDRMRYAVYDQDGKVVVITSCREIADRFLNERTDTRQRNVPDKQASHDLGLSGYDDYIDLCRNP